MTSRPSCHSCACWFRDGLLSGSEEAMISGKPDFGVCKVGPVPVATNRLDFCVGGFRLREDQAGGVDVRVGRAA